MSLAQRAAPAAPPIGRFFQEIGSLTWRNLLRIGRSPERIMFTLIMPVLFTLLFRYVFGGAIGGLQGVTYASYLIPGVGVQVIALASVTSGFAIADDLATGYFYRIRTLPTVRSAVPLARMAADLGTMVAQVLVLVAIGSAVGFRAGSVPGLVLGALVLLLFGISLSLAFATLGLLLGRPEAVNTVAMPLVFPLTMASSAFVPPATMPGWLRAFAEHQPVSVACDSLRALALGPQDTPAVRAAFFGGQSDGALVLQSVLWSAAIAAIALVVSVRRFGRLNS